MKKLILFITSIITVFTLTACSSSSSKNKLEEVKSKLIASLNANKVDMVISGINPN